jgi:hypothetical protein
MKSVTEILPIPEYGKYRDYRDRGDPGPRSAACGMIDGLEKKRR